MDKQVQLAQRIYTKTMAGELEWKPSSRDGWYQVSFSQLSLRIGLMRGRQGGEDVILEVVNSVGDIADRISDVDLSQRAPAPGGFDGWYEALTAVFNRAQRTANGADRAIDELLNELDNENDPF